MRIQKKELIEMPIAKREPDFLKTLERMYRDSQILFEKEEYYNSCYLCGYVLECALKFLLCRFGRKSNGDNYTWRDAKQHSHKLGEMNQKLEEFLAITEGIPPQYRFESAHMCPYIFTGQEGYSHWDPAFRYGECPAWDSREYCEHYIEEGKKVYQFISKIIAGGEQDGSL